ncbi:MAG: 2-hydroxyacid dehydrogenase [Dehalococcoidia bacterium]
MNILFCTDYFPHAVEMLRKYLPEDEVLPCPIPQVRDHLSEADVIIPAMFRVDAQVIEATSARMVLQYGVGLEGVDVAAATRKGVYVANVPGSLASSNAASVAEHAIFLMLSLARKYPLASRNLKRKVLGSPLGIGLRGKTVGVVGLGSIGGELVKRLRGFDVRLLGIKRHPSPDDADRLGLDFAGGPEDLPFVLGESDFVVLALPVTGETRGLIGERALASLKEGAFIVNVARGPLIDHDALVQALASGRLAGVGLDVFWEEPIDPQDPIFDYNVIATPHIAGVTDTSYDEIARGVADNVNRVRAGLPPQNCVNLEELRSNLGTLSNG